MIRRALLGVAALLVTCAVAWAVVSGTSGTRKDMQQQAVRIGVLTGTTATATATAGADSSTSTASLTAGGGIVTTPSVTTPANSDHVLTLTNAMVAAGDIVFCTVQKGSATVGSFYCAEVTPAAGSVAIKVRNANSGSTADGTLKIGFWLVRQSALDAD